MICSVLLLFVLARCDEAKREDAPSKAASNDDTDDDFLAPHVMWAQRTDKVLLKIVENHISNEKVNVTRRGMSVTFEAGVSSLR